MNHENAKIKIQELQSVGAYTILARIGDYGEIHEFMAAFRYNRTDKTWVSGHYFKSLENAVDFARRSGRMSFSRLEEIATYLINEYVEDMEELQDELDLSEDEWNYFNFTEEED